MPAYSRTIKLIAANDPKRSKGRTPQQTWEEETQKILKEIGTEWNGIRAIARDSDRWKALFYIHYTY